MISKPRGTQDYFFELDPTLDIFANVAKMLASLNGYYEVQTPIFEHIELFKRSSGETSDVVNKELYNFCDKGNREIALRPEMTASVCRSIVENKLLNKMALPIKCFYIGPMFRYERPQSGRLRQFHQFGVECIGSGSYLDDVEMIILAQSFLNAFKYEDYELHINNICSIQTRGKWITALKKYFAKYKSQLSEDSVRRLTTNPLRILDDKVDGQKSFVKEAPKVVEFASKEEIVYFKKITDALDAQKIKYVVDETLVRGLDYYTNLVFEFISTQESLKGQPTIIGGGRYNNLIKELGGPNVDCVGFAIGLDRMAVALKNNKILLDAKKQYIKVDCVIASLNEEIDLTAQILAKMLRYSGLSVLCNFGINKITKHFKYAEKVNAQFVIIIGKKEIHESCVLVKNQKTLKQEKVKIDNLVGYITKSKQQK